MAVGQFEKLSRRIRDYAHWVNACAPLGAKLASSVDRVTKGFEERKLKL